MHNQKYIKFIKRLKNSGLNNDQFVLLAHLADNPSKAITQVDAAKLVGTSETIMRHKRGPARSLESLGLVYVTESNKKGEHGRLLLGYQVTPEGIKKVKLITKY